MPKVPYNIYRFAVYYVHLESLRVVRSPAFTTWQAQLKPQIYFLPPGQRISTYINTLSILLYSQATPANLNPIFYLCLIFYTLAMLSHLPWSSGTAGAPLRPPQTTNLSPPSSKPHNNAPTSPS
ncbi:uncharacterized protein K441DRAFT_663757 [Cenococcum geophilum 1.58]|uniref:uncharacterized protein n=1 Tax=Cenococcum geophilum 1.58 TaxID=794803 RepID=UPI00359023B6|nr:hypothetical protein K441DRAFT_663757 [Cenococcum geophilum 1.58]